MLHLRTLHHRLALVTLLLGVTSASPVLLGCSGGGEDSGEPIPADEVVPEAAPLPGPRESLFDAEGRLLPSERVLGGPLPEA